LPSHLRAPTIDGHLDFQDGTGIIASVDEVAADQKGREPVRELELGSTLGSIRWLPLRLSEYGEKVEEIFRVHQPCDRTIGVELQLGLENQAIVGDQDPHGLGFDTRAQLALGVVDSPSSYTGFSVKVEGEELGHNVINGGGLFGGFFAHGRRIPRTTDIYVGH
jgi:hypothetical protein